MTFAPNIRRIYVHAIRVTWDFESFGPLVPDVSASYALRIPRTGALLIASFRPRLASKALAVRLWVPVTRVPRGLSPPSHHAMPGVPKKGVIVRSHLTTNNSASPSTLLLNNLSVARRLSIERIAQNGMAQSARPHCGRNDRQRYHRRQSPTHVRQSLPWTR